MEGFGLTALEAMSCGSPVIAASAGALPEVVGVPESLFNPEDPHDMSLRIAQVCTDQALADAIRRTWPNTSEEIQLEAFC